MIDYRAITVLLVDGATRQTLPLAKAFKKLGCRVITYNCSKLDVGYSSKYPDLRILDKKARDDLNYLIDSLEKYLPEMGVDIVVSTCDITVEALSLNKKRLERFARIAVVDPELFYVAYDKLNTMAVCMEHHIPCPRTILSVRNGKDILDANLGYPVVVKPRKSYGAIGYRLLRNEKELNLFIASKNSSLYQYIFQEYIPQTDIQFEAAMFVDNNNEIKAAVVFTKNRWFPVDGGSSTMNITVDRPDIVDACSRLLRIIGWKGCADIDLIQDPRDGVVKIMEINPRVSGSVKICFEAGVNLAQQIIQNELGYPVTEFKEYKLGKRLRYLHGDLLWFIKSPNRFRTRPSWFSAVKTKDQIFSLSDPLPGITYSVQAIRRYKTEITKRRSTHFSDTC